MKKSERKKVKLLILKLIYQNVKAAKEDLAVSWASKGVPGAEKAISDDIKVLHGMLFVKRAVEKQMPMPVKMQIAFSNRTRYFYKNGQRDLVVSYQAYCQSCNKLVDFGNKPSEAYEFVRKYKKYCPRCGQKLWWPSC